MMSELSTHITPRTLVPFSKMRNSNFCFVETMASHLVYPPENQALHQLLCRGKRVNFLGTRQPFSKVP
ncbi:hypothetical protein CASFOL_019519 [Castilleja foliolosa]|uniref:Uncharacterized protein n=1 Tax=Castilleja foliolosa TaxID=1961234 RepID=A0ABD3D4L6_9LAMI